MRFPEYSGHFDENPLVPGAVLLEAALAGVAGRVERVGRVRFMGAVRPGEEVRFQVEESEGEVRFSASCRREVVMRGVGRVREA